MRWGPPAWCIRAWPRRSARSPVRDCRTWCVLADLDEHAESGAITGATILEVGAGGDGAPVMIGRVDETQALPCPD